MRKRLTSKTVTYGVFLSLGVAIVRRPLRRSPHRQALSGSRAHLRSILGGAIAGLVDAEWTMMAQAIRAVLLAIAIVACLADMRPSSFATQGCLSGRLCAWRTKGHCAVNE